MDYINLLKSIFAPQEIKISERVTVLEISFESAVDGFPNYEDITSFYCAFPERDTVSFRLVDPDENEMQINSGTSKNQYDSFLNNLEKDDFVEVNIYVNKCVCNQKFSVYCYEAFIEDLQTNDIYNLLSVFNNLIKDNNYIYFTVFDKTEFAWNTETLGFSSEDRTCSLKAINRSEHVHTRTENTSCNVFDEFKLLPNDFRICIDYDNNPFTEIFGRIRTMLSLLYISNISSLNENKFYCQIHGYKNVALKKQLSNVNTNDVLFAIYDWIYSSGSVVDKLLITRNVLSLYCQNEEIDSVKEDLFSSIKSNFQLYLRKNVDQYLKAKNEVANYITKVVSDITDNISNLVSGLKNNMVALLGFLGTVFLVNVVAEQPLQNIFTADIVRLFECVILGSIVYEILCVCDTKRKHKSYQESYEALQRNYNSIFSDIEIAEIFNNDLEYNLTEKTYKKNIKATIVLWNGFILVVFIVVEIIGEKSIFSLLLNLLKI